jgi:hypothetical protein
VQEKFCLLETINYHDYETLRNKSSHKTHKVTAKGVILVKIETGKLATVALGKRTSPLSSNMGSSGTVRD